MLKYYKELERPSDYLLPLVKENYSRNQSRIIYNPASINISMNKINLLFQILQNINLLFRSIDLKAVPTKSSKYEMSTYEEWLDLNSIICELETIKYEILPELEYLLNQISISNNNLLYLVTEYKRILLLITKLYPSLLKEWKASLNFLSKVIEEFNLHSKIEYTVPLTETRNIKLPNAWYITPIGDLYNTGGLNTTNHKETNLIYPYEHVSAFIAGESNFIRTSKELFYERQNIIKEQNITLFQFQHYLNYIYSFATVKIDNKSKMHELESHDPRIIKIVLGVVSAEASFYSFFEKLYKFTNDHQEEFKKLNEMTSGDLNDILVRCAGFHKIESARNKTITTTSLNPYSDFYKYIIKGWDIYVIPKIIIDKKQQILAEQNLDSRFIEEHLNGEFKQYKSDKNKQYGKIVIKNSYTNLEV